MDLATDMDVRHKLYRVVWRDEVVDQVLEYFERFPKHEAWFIKELTQLHWDNKYRGRFRNHISLTAVPLATKIYEQLEIITFPFIQRVASRGWDTSGGTWAWSMKESFDGEHMADIGSCDPVKYLLLKKVKLFTLDGPNSNGEIGGQG